MQHYYQELNENPFNTIPLTFHIRGGCSDPEFAKFTEYYLGIEATIKEKKGPKKDRIRNIWIIKPGENSNRGCGIQVVQEYAEIRQMIGNSGKGSIPIFSKNILKNPY